MIGTFDQGDPVEDKEMFAAGIVEGQASFEEPITIKRYLAQSVTPDAFLQKPAPTYTSFAATAVLVELGIKNSLLVAGVLSAGDIHLQIRERLHESDENAGGAHPGDRVVFRGAEYRLIMRPAPVVVGNDVVFYDTYLRRTNANSDQAGA